MQNQSRLNKGAAHGQDNDCHPGLTAKQIACANKKPKVVRKFPAKDYQMVV